MSCQVDAIQNHTLIIQSNLLTVPTFSYWSESSNTTIVYVYSFQLLVQINIELYFTEANNYIE